MKSAIRKHRLLPALLAIAALPPVNAGEVIVSEINRETGALKTLATGSMTYAPVHLFRFQSESVKVVDACGSVYGIEQDIYGEKTLAGPLHPDTSLDQIRFFATGKFGGMGIGHDGKPWALDLSDGGRGRDGYALETDFQRAHEFASLYESRLDFSRTRIFIQSPAGYLAFFDDGRLLTAPGIQHGQDDARFIAPRNGWGGVRHAVGHSIHTGRDHVPSLITIDDAGRMTWHTLIRDDENFYTSVESVPVGSTAFGNTKALLAGRREVRNNSVYRWTESGDLHEVSIENGTERRIGAAGAFRGDLIAMPDDDIYLVSHTGGFAECPEKAVPAVIAEAPKDTSIIAAADEIKALSAAHYKAMDDAAREPLPSFSGEYSAIEPQIKQLFDKVSGFENAVVQPVREKVDAFVEKYGDENEATIKLREVTDDLWYLNSSLSWLQSALERWDEYRLNIADNLAQQASTSFLLGEYATDHSLRDEHYRAAKPWAEWALRFNPDHEKAKEYLARADSQAASAESAFKAAIQDAQWPGDAFDPGGGTEAMKMKILRYFQKHHSGSDHDQGSRYFAVRLRHDWYISQTNILDQATEWRISAYLAKTVPGDAGHAEVELVEIGTQTGDRNSGFAKRYFQSDSYLIPIERVPADDPEILQESLKLISK